MGMFDYLTQASALSLPGIGSSICACGELKSVLDIGAYGWRRVALACKRCDVRCEPGLVQALRHPADPAYDWVPEHMREACAWAGFTPIQAGTIYFENDGALWLTNGHLAISSGLDAALWQAKATYDKVSAARAEIVRRINAPRPRKPVRSVSLTERGLNVVAGGVFIALDYWQMMEALYPLAVPWVAGKTDGVLFKVPNGETVAVVMPCWEPY